MTVAPEPRASSPIETARGQALPQPGSTLLGWLDHPSREAGVHQLGDSGWAFESYAQLAERVRVAAGELREAGVGPGDVVAIAEPDFAGFASALFGALHAGATPLPLASHPGVDPHHAVRLGAILGSASPRFVVCSDGFAGDVAAVAREAGAEPTLLRLGGGRRRLDDAAEPAEVALLQFTSGATGLPRGVRITRTNLESHVSMIRDWYGYDSVDAVASWLPLHHDMGLIGQLITPVCSQTTTWRMRPEQFLLDPLRWLECLGNSGVTVTGAPTFAYSYVARRVSPERLRGLEFSGCRTAGVGAERVIPAALADFWELLADHGFRPEALSPGYGMAEATLVATGHPVGSLPWMVRVGWERMDVGMPVEIRERRPITDARQCDSSGFVVSCGRPFAGLTIRVVGDDGSPVPDATLGEITIDGPSVAAGYHGADAVGSTRFEGGRVVTGDAGFMLDGELFVVGRMGDSLKLGGRHVWAESLEIQIAAALAISPHRCVVVPRPGPVSEVVAILVEAPPPGWADRVVSLVRSEVGTSAEIVLYEAERRTILRTTSGKPRRREMWSRLAAGDISAERVGVQRGRARG